jgi:hypothetical protein
MKITKDDAVERQNSWYHWFNTFCRENKISPRQAIVRAKLDPSRVYRWAKGNTNTVQAIMDMEVAAHELIEERRQRLSEKP